MNQQQPRFMCPHCGEVFTALKNSLIPTHDYCASVCPGSQQGPRNPESDRRPPWKDGGVG